MSILHAIQEDMMENCFEIWIDNSFSPRAHERFGASLWPIYREEGSILLKTFNPDDLSPEFISNLPTNTLLLSRQEIDANLVPNSSHLTLIESPDDYAKLIRGCCSEKFLQILWQNGINFNKNCKPVQSDTDTVEPNPPFGSLIFSEYGECVPGVLCGPRSESTTSEGDLIDIDLSDPGTN
jgi:hypothetical protein